MKDLYLDKTHDILLFLKAKNFPFGKQETICLEFSPTVLLKNAALICKNVSQKTERLYFKGQQKLEPYLFCKQWSPQAPLDYSVPQQVFYKIPWARHLENSHELSSLEAQALEIKTSSKDLNLLLPSLFLLKNHSLDFIMIDPSELDLQSDALKLKEIFLELEQHWRKDLPLFFSPSHPLSTRWEALTRNPFRGPRLVDIDLCNACDHDCLFCGLHHPDLKKSNGPVAKLKAQTEQTLQMISELPPSVEMVTLGGAGEPFLHPDIMLIIRTLRQRGINVCLFSNFAHMTQALLDELQTLVFDSPMNIWIIANVSGADPQTYSKTRPSQGAKTFLKVFKHLKYNTQILRREHKAATVTLMCVVNKENFKTLPEFVALSRDIGAFNLWFKTMEPHGDVTLPLLLSPSDKILEKKMRAQAQWAAQKLDVQFLAEKSDSCEEIPPHQISSFPLLKSYLEGRFDEKASQDFFRRPRFTQNAFQKEQQNLKDSFLSPLPSPFCAIAYEYLRLTVEVEVLPCCSFKENLGKIEKQNLMEFWLSSKYSKARKDLETAHFPFCQYCPHRHINERFKSLHA